MAGADGLDQMIVTAHQYYEQGAPYQPQTAASQIATKGIQFRVRHCQPFAVKNQVGPLTAAKVITDTSAAGFCRPA